jgi:CDP-4-dehydro-6-deoxyglucose reductase
VPAAVLPGADIMSYTITLSPSGRSFRAEAGETILEAALRSGLSVNYHCTNGSCGSCRARIIDGEVSDHLHHDFTFKGAERNLPMLLLCRAIPAGDMVIEMQEALSADDIPQQQITATVTRLDQLSEDIAELQLRTPRSQTLRFLAGQHVSLQVGDLPLKNKSIASCPCNGRDLQFHFKRSAGDSFTRAVFDGLKLKDQVELVGPDGEFVLDEHSGQNMMFIAYETGFAPLKSLIEHAFSLELPATIQLLWFARNDSGHYQKNYCRAWKDALENFDYKLLTLDEQAYEAGAGAEKLQQAINRIQPYVERLEGPDAYVAVPEHLHEPIRNTLKAGSVRSIRIISDNL